MKSKLIVWVAQGFGIGRIPSAPGTWGSLLGVAWFLLLLWPGSAPLFVVAVMLSVLLAVWCCGRAEQILGQHDPGSIVLDEIVALPVALSGYVVLWWRPTGALPAVQDLALWWPVLPIGFGLFRLFDIWKPWPIRALQRLPGGWGVVADDVAAGGLSALLLWLGGQALAVHRLGTG